MQVKEDEKGLNDSEKMYENKTKIDEALGEHMREDFMDEIYEVEKGYSQELEEIQQRNNELTSSNRNKKVEMSLLGDKMR